MSVRLDVCIRLAKFAAMSIRAIDIPWLHIKPVFLLSGHLLSGLRVSVAPAPGSAAEEAEPASFDLPPLTRISVLRS
jgi:hypothetical protein